MIVSGTRGAWLALGLTAVVALGLWLAGGRARDRVGAIVGTTQGRVALAGVAIVAVVGLVVLGPTVADRVLFGNDGGRISYWTAAIRMFTDAPVSGVGPGMWAPQRIFHTAEGELDYYIPHAHNVYLQTAADSGLIGLVCGRGRVRAGRAARLGVAPRRGRRGASMGRRRRPRRGLLRRPPAVRRVREHAGGDLRVRVPDRLARRGAAPIPARPAGWPVSSRARSGRARRRARSPSPCGGLGPRERTIGAPARRGQDGTRGRRRVRRCGDRGGGRLDRPVDPARPARARASRGRATGDMATVGPALEAVVDADGLPAAWMDLAWLQRGGRGRRRGSGRPRGRPRLGQQQAAITLPPARPSNALETRRSADHWYATALTAGTEAGGGPVLA